MTACRSAPQGGTSADVRRVFEDILGIVADFRSPGLRFENFRGIVEALAAQIRVDSDGEPNLLLYKPNIKYMSKDEQR